MKRLSLALATLLAPALLAAQSPASISRAVNSITPEDIRRRIGIIADDSMRGRDTPSPELEKVAAYVAREFRRFGLQPGGDSGTYLQRYHFDRVQFVADSSIAFVHGAGDDVTLRYATDFVFADNAFASGDYAGALVVLHGPLTGATPVDTAALAGKMLVLATPARNRAERARVFGWRPAGVVQLASDPDSVWAVATARSSRPQLRDPVRGVGSTATLRVRVQSLRPALARAGLDLDALRQAGPAALEATPLPGVQVHVHATVRILKRNSAPNVVGILEGSDPRLRQEYVVFSAHMDHVGVAGPAGSGQCRAIGADSICNGADDDASGTIAVVGAAEAFARLRPRPKRSILFLTVSGEEKGLWGSSYFTEHPTVPLANVVADLNIDMVGRNWTDTIVVIGTEHSDLGVTLHRVAAAHPELGMRPIDDLWPQENFYFRSDHYNFARKGVPILFFFNGTHPDYHRVGDEVARIDAEKESRIVKLAFYLGLEIANRTERPKWNPASYRQIAEGAN
ncbi:MAG: M20/M25/M40 family metallo-hydrolase [Gemmatimonadetes bacterium]|nr:M20/M25/M40 family metallo-hydrolase [Gemmatimonadota bacterium]